MLEYILGPLVATAEAYDDLEERLYPSEIAFISGAVDSRRREFSTTRGCARQAMAAINISPGPILSGDAGEPVWPEGVVGSITHCKGFRGAAVAHAGAIRSVGIDGEPNVRLPLGVLGAITNASERFSLIALSEAFPEVCWDRLLFSAKESVYKAWYPIEKVWLDFEDIEIDLDPYGAFKASVRYDFDLAGSHSGKYSGAWILEDGIICTAVVDGY